MFIFIQIEPILSILVGFYKKEGILLGGLFLDKMELVQLAQL